MNKKQILIFFIAFELLFFHLFSCSDDICQLEYDKLLRQYFSSKEIDSLRSILDFFEKYALKDCLDTFPKSSCYLTFLEKARTNSENCGCINLNIDTIQEYIFIDNIKTGIFNQIWQFDESYSTTERSRYKVIRIKNYSKYMDFLEKAGIHEPFIKEYHYQISISGSISPGLYVFVEQNFDKTNLNSERIRLLLAIHYLTLNYYRKIKY